MADITKATISPDLVSAQQAVKVTGLLAGEALADGDCVYIASDGTLMAAIDTQCTIANIPDFIGIVVHATAVGEPAAVFGNGTRLQYGSGLTPGAILYTSDTKGLLSDAAIATSDPGCAICIDDTDIMILR